MEQELATYSIVPSEDLDLVAMALLLDAAAFVTCEEKILSATALSLSLNWQTAFVHTHQLTTALKTDFQFRWSQTQSGPRQA